MKKIISIYGIMGSLLIAMLPGVSSCDKLEDELFKKNTYIIHNGWQDYSLEVADDNTTVLPVYFGVNGTSGNDKEIHIMMEVDPDTLDAYNKDKYKSQTDLYYKILPEGTYTFDADSWNIKSGELNAAAYIHIDLNKIREVGNLYNDYVLPCASLLLQEKRWERINIRKYWHISVSRTIIRVFIVVRAL